MATTDNIPLRAFLALILANAVLAMGPWFVRLADVGPTASGFWRLAIAAPILLFATRASGQPLPHNPKLILLLLFSGVFFALDLASWHAGILMTKLMNGALLGNIASFFFTAYGFAVARRLPGRIQWIAIAFALIGVGLLLGRSYDLSPRYIVGDLLCILAGVFYTFYLIIIDQTRSRIEAWPAIAISTIGGILPLLLFALFMGETLIPTRWTPLILLALGSQVIGQGLMVYVMGHLSPLVVGIGFLSQPAIAAAIGWLAYDERLDVIDLTGMIAIAVALLLVRTSSPRPRSIVSHEAA